MAGKAENKNYWNMKMRTITCFGDRTSGTFLIIVSDSQTNNFVNVNVFNSVASPRVLSYRCAVARSHLDFFLFGVGEDPPKFRFN